MIFYHIDRTNSLEVGQVVTLIKDFHEYPNSYKNVILKLYPEGLSRHGFVYSTIHLGENNEDQQKETAFELNRQLYFPDKISRFQAFFCFQTIEYASKFARDYCKRWPEYKVYEVEVDHDNYFVGDMNLVLGSTVITSYIDSHDYWSGGHSSNPIFEVLVKPPLKILSMVNTENRCEQI